MHRTLAAIALLGFSGAASAAPADDSESERTTLLRIISEGTAAIAAAAACAVDKGRIDRAIATQSDLIKASAMRMGYAEPDILIKIRDEGLKRIREGVERQGSSAHCDTAIAKFEPCFVRTRADFRPGRAGRRIG
jgi:hypothetical protein